MPKYNPKKANHYLNIFQYTMECPVQKHIQCNISFVSFLNVLTFSTYPRRTSEPFAICHFDVKTNNSLRGIKLTGWKIKLFNKSQFISGDYSLPSPQTVKPSLLSVPTGYILVPLHWAKCINK